MKELPLVGGGVTLVSERDFDWLRNFRWHLRPDGEGTGRTYVRTKIGTRTVYLHRMILRCPDHLVVDHVNGNPLDNTRENLRVASVAQNNRNRRRTSQSGFRGVYRQPALKGKPWRVKIRVAGRYLCGGLFATPEEAARRYDELARQNFGEFAVLNYP